MNLRYLSIVGCLLSTMVSAQEAAEAPKAAEAAKPPLQLRVFQAVAVAPGSSVTVECPIERSGFDEPVTLKMSNLPEGVTVKQVTIPAGAMSGMLEIVAASNATPRVRSAVVSASGGTATASDVIVVRVSFESEKLPPGTPVYMSVKSWVFLGIRSAQLTGIPVLEATLERAGRFVDTCASGPSEAPNSRYTYVPGEEPKLSLTAAGLLTRQYLGWDDQEPDLLAGCAYLMENRPPDSATSLGSMYYYYYYATQVLHHLEGPNFDQWNHLIREHILRQQEKDGDNAGSWNPTGVDWGKEGGRMYATGLALLTLQAPYRHLPMFRQAQFSARSTKADD